MTEVLYCPHCGRKRDADATFCGGCGTSFDTSAAFAPAAVVVRPSWAAILEPMKLAGIAWVLYIPFVVALAIKQLSLASWLKGLDIQWGFFDVEGPLNLVVAAVSLGIAFLLLRRPSMRIAGIAAGLAVVFLILRVAQTPNSELADPMFILTVIVLGAAGYASWRAYEALRRVAAPNAARSGPAVPSATPDPQG